MMKISACFLTRDVLRTQGTESQERGRCSHSITGHEQGEGVGVVLGTETEGGMGSPA